MNSGKGPLTGSLPLTECSSPSFHFFAQVLECQPAVRRRKAGQLDNSGGQEGFGSARIVTTIMMEGRRELDEALQKCLFRLAFVEPDFFPDFVGFEELLRVEMRQAAFEFFFVFRGFHRRAA